MLNGSYTLAQFPLPTIELACEKCGRRGRLLKPKLIEAYRVDVADPLPKYALCELGGTSSGHLARSKPSGTNSTETFELQRTVSESEFVNWSQDLVNCARDRLSETLRKVLFSFD